MKHNLKYFKKLFDNPASFPNGKFYKIIKKWAQYVIDHKDEFDYLKDDEWKEIRERILGELERREDLRDEFEEFNEQLEASNELKAMEKIALYRRWLAFLRENKFEFEFTEEKIVELEEGLEALARAVQKSLLLEEKLRIAEIDTRKSIEELDDEIFEYYERTGKRPVLTSIKLGNRFKGN